jgi:branched-chain amino acid transport system permease protein
MVLFFQRVLDGIATGAVYAALALGMVLVYRATGILNFAQGEMAMLSTYATWFLWDAGLGIWGAVAVSLVASFAGGALIERIIVRPVERKSPAAVFIVLIGLWITLNAGAGLLFGSDGRTMGDLFGGGGVDVGGVRISADTMGVLGVLTAVCAVLWLLFSHTKLGLVLRGVASNPSSAALVGIPVGRMYMIGWGLGAALGALAGALITTSVYIEPNMMIGILVYAFAAAILGGFDSPPGAIVGGLALGVTESLASGYVDWIGSALKLSVAFVVIIAVLLVRPTGLFGRPEVARV